MIYVIGNGPSLKGANLGAKIDACSTVIRFSNFETKKFEKDVGSRTDIWFGYQKIHPDLKKFKEVIFPWIGKVNIQNRYDKIEKACKSHKIKCSKLSDQIVKLSYEEMEQEYLSTPKPTAGLAGIVYAMAKSNDVYIAGFDSYQNGEFYYKAGDVKQNTLRKHDIKKEKEVIDNWLKRKMIKRLR